MAPYRRAPCGRSAVRSADLLLFRETSCSCGSRATRFCLLPPARSPCSCSASASRPARCKPERRPASRGVSNADRVGWRGRAHASTSIACCANSVGPDGAPCAGSFDGVCGRRTRSRCSGAGERLLAPRRRSGERRFLGSRLGELRRCCCSSASRTRSTSTGKLHPGGPLGPWRSATSITRASAASTACEARGDGL